MDLAVVAVSSLTAVEVIQGAAGLVKGAIVIGGGFSETGFNGALLEAELKEVSAKSGIRIVGPNCMGIYDTISSVDTFFIPRERAKRPGPGVYPCSRRAVHSPLSPWKNSPPKA